MLHRAWQHCCLGKVPVPYTVLCPTLPSFCLSRTGPSASLHSSFRFSGVRPAMQTFRQRRTSDRLATKSHRYNAKEASESLSTLQTTPAEPAAKKRKTNAVKPTRKREDHSTSQHQAVPPRSTTEEATSSADTDTSFDATPALASVPSGIPASIPAHVPADPSVLHCWTKDSMAQAAAHLAERDPG